MHDVLGEGAGVDRGLDVVVRRQRAVGLAHRDRQRQAALGAAVVLADDDVLTDVDESTREVTGSAVRSTVSTRPLSRAVRGG